MARLFVSALLTSAAFLGGAEAQSVVDRAAEAFDRGEFDRSVATLQHLDEATGLTREDLARALFLRAAARRALGAGDEEVFVDLRALAVVDPHFTMPETAPPSLVTSFEAAREAVGPVGLSATTRAEQDADGTQLSVTITVDAASLTRIIRIHFRSGGEWQAHDGPALNIPPSTSPTEYYVEVLGPARVLLFSVGSANDPLRPAISPVDPPVVSETTTMPPPTSPVRDLLREPAEPRRSRKGLWIGVGVGAAAVVGAVVTVFVVTSSRATRFEILDPMVDLRPGS